MVIKAAINGFGRIGRIALRIASLKHANELQIVAINTSGKLEIDGCAHLFKYDTAYREFAGSVSFRKIQDVKSATENNPEIGMLIVNGQEIPVLAQPDPEKLPWKKYAVDVVIECTGVFTDREGAMKHAKAGANRVVISAPAKGENVGTYVLGVNEYSGEGEVLSSASCTTNCIAPVAAVLKAKFGIEKAMVTTVHSYTGDQNLQDNSHKDLRRARAAAMNIVPTTTGAAIATTETIPALKGLFDGVAIRIPVITGSITDLVFVVGKDVTVKEVNDAFEEAVNKPDYKGILAVTRDPIVSGDIIGRSESAIVDLSLTQVVAGNMVKVLAWYDNEWGYTSRLIEQVIRVGKKLHLTETPTDGITKQFSQRSS